MPAHASGTSACHSPAPAGSSATVAVASSTSTALAAGAHTRKATPCAVGWAPSSSVHDLVTAGRYQRKRYASARSGRRVCSARMVQLDDFYGPNAGYVAELLEREQTASVPLEPGLAPSPAAPDGA